MCVHMCVCIHICVHIYICIHIYIYMHIYTYIHIYIHRGSSPKPLAYKSLKCADIIWADLGHMKKQQKSNIHEVREET